MHIMVRFHPIVGILVIPMDQLPMVEVVMEFHLRTTTISDPLKKHRRHLSTNTYTRLDIRRTTFLENLGKPLELCELLRQCVL